MLLVCLAMRIYTKPALDDKPAELSLNHAVYIAISISSFVIFVLFGWCITNIDEWV